MNKSLIETVIDEERGIEYIFTANFGFLRELESQGFQLGLFYSRLAKGNTTLEETLKALQCSLVKVGETETNFKSAEKYIIEIVERFGIMEANSLLYDMLTRAMIGDIKKSEAVQMTRTEQRKKIMEILFPNSPSKISWKAGSLWMASSAIFGFLGGLSISFF